ncbi:MAG: mechanosensitive ion channel family protein [Candidatus Zixiibacteriota bacterium]
MIDLSSLPPWLAETIIFLAIVAGAYFLSELVVLIINLLKRMLAARTKTDLDDRILDAIKAPVRYTMIFVGATVALKRLDLMVGEQSDWIFKITGGVVFVGFALVATMVFLRVVKIFTRWYADKVAAKTESNVDDELLPLVQRVLNIIIMAIGVVTVLDHFTVDVKGLIAVLGVGSLAIALAAQDTVANMIAGFILMIDRPFRKGDRVQLASGETVDVYDIGLRSSKFMTFDNTLVIVPNNDLVKAKVTNLSYPEEAIRVIVTIGVAYGSDIDKVKSMLVAAAKAHKAVLEDPEPAAYLASFEDSSVMFQLICRVGLLNQQWITGEQLRCAIYKDFQRAGIEIPFPQRVVHISRNASL